MNNTIYNRAVHSKKKGEEFTVISRSISRDTNLNYFDKGLLLEILSNKDNYEFKSDEYKLKSGFGDVVYYNSIKKLQKLGYLSKVKLYCGYVWTINEKPVPPTKDQKLECGNPKL